jgi:hypothetical protein
VENSNARNEKVSALLEEERTRTHIGGIELKTAQDDVRRLKEMVEKHEIRTAHQKSEAEAAAETAADALAAAEALHVSIIAGHELEVASLNAKLTMQSLSNGSDSTNGIFAFSDLMLEGDGDDTTIAPASVTSPKSTSATSTSPSAMPRRKRGGGKLSRRTSSNATSKTMSSASAESKAVLADAAAAATAAAEVRLRDIQQTHSVDTARLNAAAKDAASEANQVSCGSVYLLMVCLHFAFSF